MFKWRYILQVEPIITYCLEKESVNHSFSEIPNCISIKSDESLFAISNFKPLQFNDRIVKPFHFISLKCDPVVAKQLRQSYNDIITAFHQNQHHWITILLNGQLEDPFINGLIDESYYLVRNISKVFY